MMGSPVRMVGAVLITTVLAVTFTGTAAAQSDVSLSGTVTDGPGNPLTGSLVQALVSNTSNVVASSPTDGNGFYSMTLAPGTYDLKAIPPAGSGFQPTTVRNRTINADTTLNFVLVAEGAAHLRGRVLDKAGEGAPGQNVSLSLAGGSSFSTTTDGSGAYSFEVAPGDYQITVERSGNPATVHLPQHYQLQRHSPVLSLTGDTVLDLALPAHRVDVHVQDSAGNPVGGVDLTANNPFGGPFCCSFITVAGLTFERGYSFYNSPVTTDPGGDSLVWLFQGADNGDMPYTFTATPPAGSGFLTTSTTAPVTGDTEVIITLASEPVVLSGRVLDKAGGGAPDQNVSLSLAGGSSFSTTTDGSGGYSFEVAPGDYQITVERSGNPATVHLPQHYQLQRHSPVLSLTQDTVLDLALPAHRVDVHVQDSAGNPVDGVDLTANNPFGGPFCCSFITVAGLTFERGYSFYSSPVTTDPGGDSLVWLFRGADNGDMPYTFTATPPAGSRFLTTGVEVVVKGDLTVVIVLQRRNDPPVAQDQQVTTTEDTPVDFTLGATDPDSDPLTFTAGAASHGQVACHPAGACTYTPALDYFGPDRFEFTVDDGNGGTDTGVVTITVVEVPKLATRLVLEPAIVKALPGVQLYLGNLTARLTAGGAPLAGRTVVMTVGGRFVCSAVTNSNGVAVCSGTINELLAIALKLGYDAGFAGDADHLATSGHGPLVRAGPVSVA